MKAKYEKATMAQMAKIVGMPESSVRRHRREGRFDMDDFLSVAKYVVAYNAVKEFEEIS